MNVFQKILLMLGFDKTCQIVGFMGVMFQVMAILIIIFKSPPLGVSLILLTMGVTIVVACMVVKHKNFWMSRNSF
jgi:hypothetical protein